MNFLKIICFSALVSSFSAVAQNGNRDPIRSGDNETKNESNIIKSSLNDTVFVKIELKNAFYDVFKNNLPFYIISKTTGYSQNASPKLIVKNVQVVSEPHASVISKWFGSVITKNFEIIKTASLCKGKNLNKCQLIPFRINSSNQIEELIDYEVNWVISNEGISVNKLKAASAAFRNSSILASGDWYKIGITQNGIHKIGKSFLTSIGINTSSLDPRKIRIYGNGGTMLPENNGSFRNDDLVENSIMVVGEADGSFDNSDYILFYGTSTDSWKKTNASSGLKFKHEKNFYSDTSFYFININSDITNRKRIDSIPSTIQASNVSTNTYDYLNFHEENLTNLGKTGRTWFGEYFDVNTSYTFNWNDGDYLENDTLIIEASLAALSNDVTQFSVNGNGVNLNLATSGINIAYYLHEYASQAVKTGTFLNTNTSSIILTVNKLSGKNSIGWLDYLTFNARRKLVLNSKQLLFRDSRVAKKNNICDFNISTTGISNINLWNVSDPLHPFIQSFNSSGSSISFRANADSVNEYCIAPTNDFYSPTFVGKIQNQNLHAIQQADYIVITPAQFLDEANQLAQFHQQKEGLRYAVATTDQIYNEFSSGRQDISAIRDFIRMIYSRNPTEADRVKYVLLLGDGSYNNKTRSLLNNSNLVPTYQSINSLSAINSLATDDFYGLMDFNEGSNAEGSGIIDIGIGRLTCRTKNEVKAVINKIENYYKTDKNFQINSTAPQNCNSSGDSPMGDWRNNILFLADDGDYATHMKQSDGLANVVEQISPVYNIDKINLDAYQRFSTPGGHRYPDAAADLVKKIKKGVLVFNYTGHGGEVGLTEERIVDIPMINGLDNFNKLPLFITATCEFTRYDDPARTSAGELCLLNSNGGAIALLTTCRVAYSNYNEIINTLVVNKLFQKKADNKWPTLGDAVQQTKSGLPAIPQYANFHLIGDPALPLAYPELKVKTTKINSKDVLPISLDTLSALSKVIVNGEITNELGTKLTNFNGIVYSSVFDKEEDVICLLNDPESSVSSTVQIPFQFKLQKNILYKGKTEVKNGDFSFTFLVPKDISFALGPGRISYYVTNGLTDGNGYYNNIVVGGGAKNVVLDNEGPKVDLFLNDQNFISGGITNEKPILYADLTDSSGINTLGTSIGHDISVVLDENSSSPVILNDYYEANLNTYQSGRVRYPFSELSEGGHRLTFKVWDIQNNSNTVYSDFIVAKSADLALIHVLNYPNPFTTHTKFLFEHNQACNPLKVVIQIYTVSGKAVKTLQQTVTCEGFKPEGIEWDGKDDFGDKLARGVYIYKLAILDSENKKAEKIEKLVILN